MKALPSQPNLFLQVPKPRKNVPKRLKILQEELHFYMI